MINTQIYEIVSLAGYRLKPIKCISNLSVIYLVKYSSPESTHRWRINISRR